MSTNNTTELAGKTFHLLTVKKRCGKTSDGHARWRCLCKCGAVTFGSSTSILKGRKRSCGCLRILAAKKRVKQYGVWNDGKSYPIQSGGRCYKTRHAWSRAVIRHNGNKCQTCGWSAGRCDTHHITPRSQGGLHTISNGMVLCPNHHRLLVERILGP